MSRLRGLQADNPSGDEAAPPLPGPPPDGPWWRNQADSCRAGRTAVGPGAGVVRPAPCDGWCGARARMRSVVNTGGVAASIRTLVGAVFEDATPCGKTRPKACPWWRRKQPSHKWAAGNSPFTTNDSSRRMWSWARWRIVFAC